MTAAAGAPTSAYWEQEGVASAFAALSAPPYLLDLIESRPVGNGRLALDVGCGGGRNTVQLLHAGYRVVAVDLHRAMVERTASRCVAQPGARLAVAQASAAALPVGDAGCALVVCHGVLHNLIRPDQLAAGLRELGRVLADDGVLSLNLFTGEHLDPCLRPSPEPDTYALPNGQVMTLLPTARLERMIQAAGLRTVGAVHRYLRPGDPGVRSVYRAELRREETC